MKNFKKYIYLSLFAFVLYGCSVLKTNGTSSLASTSTSTTTSTTTYSSASTNTNSTSSTGSQVRPTTGTSVLEIYQINDLHGKIEKSSTSLGLDYISNYIKTKRGQNPFSLFIANGDLFQGSLPSNITKGRAVVELLNEMNLDCTSVGNHEFDWGIDVIGNYKDGNVLNGEADFPFLGANIIEKSTASGIDFMDDYLITYRGGYKIGIIGTIGYGLESSIAYQMVKDYEFLDPLNSVKMLTEKLRAEESCDFVIVATHDDGTNGFNENVAALTGNQYVDAVLNGHSHRSYTLSLSRAAGTPLPVIQSGSDGAYVGKILLTVDNKTKKVTNSSIENVRTDALLNNYDSSTHNLLTSLSSTWNTVAAEILATAGESINTASMGVWMADVMRSYTNADVAVQNSGGVRGPKTPLSKGANITPTFLYEVMPFDNIVKYCDMTGSALLNYINAHKNDYYSGNLSYFGSTVLIDGVALNSTQIYRVATIDYVYDDPDSIFYRYGMNEANTFCLIRDLMEMDIRLQYNAYGSFSPSNGALISK